MNKRAKHAANNFLYKYSLYSKPTFQDIKKIIESKSFVVVLYNKYKNKESVERLVCALHLESEIENNDSFIYVKDNLKLVFINSDLSEEDKYCLLCHELGHILDPNLQSAEISYSKIMKEEFANEFSFYINNPTMKVRFMLLFRRKKALCITVAALLILSGAGYSVFRSINARNAAVPVQASAIRDTEGVYYVTSGGKKFHRGSCPIVKHRSDLTEYTLEQAAANGYTPCHICIGEEKSE